MSRLENTGKSIKDKLKKMDQSLEKISQNKSDVEKKENPFGKVKRTFYLNYHCSNKLDKLRAKMLVEGRKISISDIVEKAIDLFYDKEMNEKL